jgi:hypothetical protein
MAALLDFAPELVEFATHPVLVQAAIFQFGVDFLSQLPPVVVLTVPPFSWLFSGVVFQPQYFFWMANQALPVYNYFRAIRRSAFRFAISVMAKGAPEVQSALFGALAAFLERLQPEMALEFASFLLAAHQATPDAFYKGLQSGLCVALVSLCYRLRERHLSILSVEKIYVQQTSIARLSLLSLFAAFATDPRMVRWLFLQQNFVRMCFDFLFEAALCQSPIALLLGGFLQASDTPDDYFALFESLQELLREAVKYPNDPNWYALILLIIRAVTNPFSSLTNTIFSLIPLNFR